MNSGIDPDANATVIVDGARRAADKGAAILFTPEMCGLLDQDRRRAAGNVVAEERNHVLSTVRHTARDAGIWIVLGSLAVKGEGQRWANRTFVIDDQGQVVARYDKIHMFEAALDNGERWSEASAYQPGERVVTAETPAGRLGLSICYDVRFPALYDALGRRECDMIAIPSAFTRPTGRDHWHVLQRARAIESSCYVVSAAQAGEHEDGRATFGHSMVVDPWGEIILDMGGEETGLGFAEIDPDAILRARRQVPSLANRRGTPTFPA
ncbi:carbon-nitrogen hydrolase family protein [Aurantiacibacter spongiae]|uniref:Carbon-nitrogen hydrolase family protein n=2 Tax=Aurantiacibacter spongiae TaxID=2488860 RepID=A0A3N5DTB8_9SPHN|nr:carbon-nitrogen hydrolase family protein [Aurantiacibacter spongiae]